MEMTTENMQWNSHAQYAFGLYKLITQSLGIWPFDCHSIRSKIQTIIVIIIEIVMMMSMLTEVNLDCGEVNDIIEMYAMASCCLIVIVKLPTLKINNHKILAIVSSCVNDWMTVKHLKAFEIMKRNAKLARFVCLYQMIFAYVITTTMILGPLAFLAVQANISVNITNNSSDVMIQPLPIPTICFYGEMPPYTYASVYLFQTIYLYLTSTANVGGDCFFFGITLHIVGQFEWLGVQFESLNIETNEKERIKKLQILVRKHNQLIQFADYLEDTFNMCIMVMLSLNIILILLNAMQIIVSLRIGDMTTVINGFIILNVVNLQIFLYSYAGDRLSSEMENLQTAIYSSAWYDLPPKAINDISFIMLRTCKQFNLTAGKVYAMKIDSFKNILKAILSYFSVMQAMFEE